MTIASYIRTANSANWVSFVGGENITFYAYSGILWEVCRSTAAPLTATADLNFASIAAGATAELTITVPGAASTNAVVLGPPAGLEAGLMATGRVSAADTVTIRLHNTTAGAIDPADATWRATVLR